MVSWIVGETAWLEAPSNALSIKVTRPMHLWPLAHCRAPALKLRRSNPRNLFPCDWQLCSPQREGRRKNTSQERQFNMTKPVPGDPLFSSQDPHEALFAFSPLSWSLVPPFLFSTSSCPLQVHFRPTNANIPLLPPYVWTASSTFEYALKNGGPWMLPVTLD